MLPFGEKKKKSALKMEENRQYFLKLGTITRSKQLITRPR